MRRDEEEEAAGRRSFNAAGARGPLRIIAGDRSGIGSGDTVSKTFCVFFFFFFLPSASVGFRGFLGFGGNFGQEDL